jgi:copper homeostasis protein
MPMPLLEVCVGDPESLEAAVAGGADRIELCSALEIGGLTPTPGLMALATAAPVPVYAMVRPRGGGFVFSGPERRAMLADIAAIRAAGLSGAVLGASRPDGTLDRDTLADLVGASAGLGLTLHRAFDLVPAIEPAVELAVDLGFERILTSGRAVAAMEGLADLARAHALADGRLAVMAGSGLSAGNVGALLAHVPLGEVHGSCSATVGPGDANAQRLGFGESRRRTDADAVRRMKAALGGSG